MTPYRLKQSGWTLAHDNHAYALSSANRESIPRARNHPNEHPSRVRDFRPTDPIAPSVEFHRAKCCESRHSAVGVNNRASHIKDASFVPLLANEVDYGSSLRVISSDQPDLQGKPLSDRHGGTAAGTGIRKWLYCKYLRNASHFGSMRRW